MADQLIEEIKCLLSLEGTVLLDIDPYLIDEEDGAVVVTCPDGRYFSDIFMHHDRMQRTNCREFPLIHPLPRHGGALVLAPTSPLVRLGSTMQDDLYEEIVEAMKWIGIKKIVLSAHYRCSKASTCNVGAAQAMNLLFAAKRAVKAKLASYDPVVSCYFHIDFGPDHLGFGKKRRVLSYYADREGWEKIQR